MAKTLEQMMSYLEDPKKVELQAKYENARLAVNMSWTIASKAYESVEELTAVARFLKTEIEKDFNSTLHILEDSDGGSKTEPSEVLRPS